MLLEAERPVEIGLAAGGDDEMRPVLTHVRLTIGKKNGKARRGQIDATDSYMAVRVPVAFDDDDNAKPGTYLVHADAFKGKGVTRRRLDGGELVVTKKDGSELRFPLKAESEVGTFPNFDALWPEGETSWEVGFNAYLLYRLARALGTETLRVRFTMQNGEPTNLRPFTCYPQDHRHNAAKAILMPVRLEGSPE